MPRIVVPEDKTISAGDPIESGARGIGSAGVIGELQSASANAVAETAKLGTIQRTEGAQQMANAGAVGQIMMKQGAAAVAQYADIGKSQAQVGQYMMKMGQDYFEQANAAIQDGIYNNSYAGASKELNQRVQDRINKPTDENGAPTFASLQSDIEAISGDVYNKYGGKIVSPEARARFTNSFTSLSTNQQIMAMKEARQQQLDYSKGSLQTGLNTAVSNALAGPQELLPSYIAEGNQQIDSAYKNGYISYEEATQQKDKIRGKINKGYMEIQAQKDPLGTAQKLSSSSNEQLGINSIERADLVDTTNSRLRSLASANKHRAAEEAALQKQQFNFNNDELDLGISKGTIGETDIAKSYKDGKISHGQMVDLTQKVIKTNGDNSVKTAKRAEISSDITSKEILTGKYSSGQINDHYKYTISTQGGDVPLFDPNSPTDKSRIAAQYKAPVTDYTRELSGVIQSGTPEQILSAAKSYQFVSQKNPLAVSSLNDRDRAALYSITEQLTYTKEDPAVIIDNVRKNILSPDKTKAEFNAQRFNSEDKFTSKNIMDTVKGMYDKGSISGWWSGQGKTQITNDDATIISSILKQNYMITGNADSAIALTKDKTQGIFGPSSINSKVTGGNQTMFFPPEYSYPQFNFDTNGQPAMRVDLERQIAPYLKSEGWAAHQGDIKADQIFLTPNRYQPGRQQGATTYLINAQVGDHSIPLVDPKSGQPLTYSPDGEFINGLRGQTLGNQRTHMYQDQQELKQVRENLDPTAGLNKTLDKYMNVSLADPVDSMNSFRQKYGLGPLPASTRGSGVNQTDSLSLGVGTRAHVVSSALKFLGMNEVTHRVELGGVMGKMLNQSVDPSKTPWCAGFVNTVLESNGIHGTGSLAARSFLKYGQSTSNPEKGDIVVLSRSSDPSKGHVGFYMGSNSDGTINILGGNQGNMVSIKKFNQGAILGFRKLPSGEQAEQLFTNNGPLAGVKNKALPLGIRQNNPGNIAKNGSRWDGEVPNADTNFKQFATPEDGISAIVRTVQAYDRKYQVNTVNDIIHRYSKTDQAEYITNLSNALNVDPNEKLDVKDVGTLAKLVKGIIKQENGYVPYPDETIMTGIMRNI